MSNVTEHSLGDESGADDLAQVMNLLDEAEAGIDEPAKKSRKKKLPKIIRPDEVDALMDAIPKPKPQDHRDRCILELLYRAGLRVSEVVGLHVRDLDLDEGTIQLFDAKGGDGTAYFDPASVRPFFEKWQRIRPQWVDGRGTNGGNRDLLFVSRLGKPVTTRYVQRMVTRRAELAGIHVRCTPHTLRHTYATELLREGFTLRQVQVALRHANVGTTERYTWVLDEEMRRKMGQRQRREA